MKLPISPRIKWKLYSGYRLCMIPIDWLSLMLGKRDELTPSVGILFLGGGDFKKIGEEFRNYFIEFCNLKSTDKVLDIGCGMGRMAVPLTKYLNQEGQYCGFDVFKEGISWCKKKITKQYPNFEFKLVDVFNSEYNPSGKLKGSNFNFPCEDNYFDFVFATSVFTHMVPKDLENYISEISHVLNKGGRFFLTFFLLNKDSISFIHRKKSKYNFDTNTYTFSTMSKKTPDYITAYQENFIRNLFIKYGLQITEPIKYGSWCGRKSNVSFQDFIIGIK